MERFIKGRLRLKSSIPESEFENMLGRSKKGSCIST